VRAQDSHAVVRFQERRDPMSDFTTFLFARPSFIEGLARLFGFSGSLNEYNSSPSPEVADTRAITADWMAVGADLRGAIATSGAEIEREAVGSFGRNP
jgi:hypothetical protein